MRWPAKIAAGRESDEIVHAMDLLPTFATLAGFKVPTDRVIDGVDQTNLLLGKDTDGARDTYFYQGNGVRKGKWKLLLCRGSGG